jgi:hypothetical protein
MKRTWIAASALAIGLGAVAGQLAFAQQSQRGTAAERAACEPDVYRLCAAEIPDENKIIACLKKNKAKLSKACHKVMFDE